MIEMIVVISIMVMLMAFGVPAMITAQSQADEYSTPNLIESAIATCQRNARQFGSAGAIYGFTLKYTSTIKDSSNVNHVSADLLTPWVYYNGGLHYQTTGTPAVNHMADFGKTPLWNADDIAFVDRYRPCDKIVVDTTNTITPAANSYLHIAFEPRTGFPHTKTAGSANAAPLAADIGGASYYGITDPATAPNRIEIQIWTTYNGRAQSRVIITKTGVVNAHNGP